MRDRKPGNPVKGGGTVRTGRPPREEPPAAGDPPILVCLGEFGLDEARDFRRLWETTWSQDARGKAVRK
jgi:hypothetical protein